MNLPLLMGLPLLRMASRRTWGAFRAALDHPAEAQEAVLADILSRARRSSYGRHVGLETGSTRRVFDALPPVDYPGLAPWIESDLASGRSSFSPEKVLYFERTSGSSGAAKAIAYTASLRSAFDHMFRIWAYDLLQAGLALRSGKAFMSVSPPLIGKETASGVAVGTEDDTAYLSGPLAALLRPFLVAPSSALRLRSGDAFKDVLAAALLSEPRLEVISVWNPSFLLLLFEHLRQRLPMLAQELSLGSMQREGIPFRFAPVSRERLAKVGRADRDGWTALWPYLQLVSCWTDAEAARPARALAAQLLTVPLQGKGLLATEAPISVPLTGAPAPVPLIRDVYLELESADGSLRPLCDWREGDEGELVVTQPGGLLRYRLRDRVAICGFAGATPCLSFLGRAGGVVDLCGEKLNETFVREVLSHFAPRATFISLCPVAEGTPPYYALLTDVPVSDLAERVDQALRAALHYRIAREFGQLGPIRLVTRSGLLAELHAAANRCGIQSGNIKERALIVSLPLAAALSAAVQV